MIGTRFARSSTWATVSAGRSGAFAGQNAAASASNKAGA
jgi:hypothetical protein